MKTPDSLSYTANATEPPRDRPKTNLGGPGGPVRSRRWERQPRNRGYTYRVGQDVDDLLTRAVADMEEEQDWICTKSDMARAWLLAGQQLWIDGNVPVDGYAKKPGTCRRKP